MGGSRRGGGGGLGISGVGCGVWLGFLVDVGRMTILVYFWRGLQNMLRVDDMMWVLRYGGGSSYDEGSNIYGAEDWSFEVDVTALPTKFSFCFAFLDYTLDYTRI